MAGAGPAPLTAPRDAARRLRASRPVPRATSGQGGAKQTREGSGGGGGKLSPLRMRSRSSPSGRGVGHALAARCVPVGWGGGTRRGELPRPRPRVGRVPGGAARYWRVRRLRAGRAGRRARPGHVCRAPPQSGRSRRRQRRARPGERRRAREMFSAWGFPCGRLRLAGRAAAGRSALLCPRTAASPAPPRLPLLGGAHRRLLALGGLSPSAAAAAAGRGAAGAAPCGPRAAGGGFRPSRVAVVVKTTRYEFEQQRYRYAGLSEEDLKQLVSGGRGRRSRPPGALPPGLQQGCGGTRGDARLRRGMVGVMPGSGGVPGVMPGSWGAAVSASSRGFPGPWWGGAGCRGGERGRRRCPRALPSPGPRSRWNRAAPPGQEHSRVLDIHGLPRDLCSKRVWVLASEGFQQPSANCRLFPAVCSMKIREMHAEESVAKNPLYVLVWTLSHFLCFLVSLPQSILRYFPPSRQSHLSQIHPSCFNF